TRGLVRGADSPENCAAKREAGLRAICCGLLILLSATPAPATQARAPVRHIFVIVLENQRFDVAFVAHSTAAYLGRDLPREGALLTQYYAIGHDSLDNYIALISGQAPNAATQDDCVVFGDFRLARPTLDGDGQALGEGCVYPRMVPTLV